MLKVIGITLLASAAATAQQVAFDSYDPVNSFSRTHHYSLGSNAAYDRLGVLFQSQASGGVDEVHLPLFFEPNGRSLELEFYSENAGEPGALLGSASFTSAGWNLLQISNPAFQGIVFDLDGSIQLQSGQQYFLVVHRLETMVSGGWMLTDEPPQAPTGTIVTSLAGGTWLVEQDWMVAARVIVPAPGSAAILACTGLLAARRRRNRA